MWQSGPPLNSGPKYGKPVSLYQGLVPTWDDFAWAQWCFQ